MGCDFKAAYSFHVFISEFISPAGLPKAAYVLPLFLVYYFKNNFSQTSYINMYLTDLHQIFRFGRTLSVDDRSEVSFSIPQGTLLWQPIFVDYPLLSAELGSRDIR